MHLADSSSDLLSNLIVPTISDLQKGITPSSPAPASSGGDFWSSLATSIGQIGTAGLQVYGAVQQSKNLARVGIQPSGYVNGLPVYASTPAGVTPSNPYMLPSGMAPQPGVTYQISPGQTYSTSSFVNPLANLLSGNTGMYLMLGGSALFLAWTLTRSRKRR